MKKVLLLTLLVCAVGMSFAQQTPEELKDKFIATCESGDNEAMLALYYPNEKHKEIAEFMVNAYTNPEKYRDFFKKATEFYGLDAYKKNVSIGGFALGMLMYSPCVDDVEFTLEKKSETESMLYFVPSEEPDMRGRVRLEKIDGKWWIHQTKKEDYNKAFAFFKAADETVALGNKLLAEEASIEKFGREMEKLTKETEASMKQ